MAPENRALNGSVDQVWMLFPSNQYLLAFQHQIMDETRHLESAASTLAG